jgi:hypothetical protein
MLDEFRVRRFESVIAYQSPQGQGMRVFLAAALIALMAGSANAQGRGVPASGEAAKPKSQQEIQRELDAENAYKKSLGNIPDQGPADPWGNVRGDKTPDSRTFPKGEPRSASSAGGPASERRRGLAADISRSHEGPGRSQV